MPLFTHQSETILPSLWVPARLARRHSSTRLIWVYIRGQEENPHKKVRSDNSLMKDAREGASAAAAGSLIHKGKVYEKKMYLKLSVDVEYCWNVLESM